MINTDLSEKRKLLYAASSLFIAAVVMFNNYAQAEDWPVYLHDNNRSGSTDERLNLPLRQVWACMTNRGPRPAWEETPALQDFWQGYYGNKTRMPIDNAFRVVVAGNKVYFGSSNTGKVTCLDALKGGEQWSFFADGPIRFAPAVYNGKVYFGSDDGYVYCLNSNDGILIWKKKAAGGDELMFINGRMVSACPVSTAVAVDNGQAFWGAGVFSGAQTGLNRYLYACNAETGAQLWSVTPPRPTQGYPLLSANNLYMPAGKSTPTYFSRSNGSYLGAFDTMSSRQGGAYALLSADNKLFFGPHYSGTGSYIGQYDATTRAAETVAWGPGNYLVVTPTHSYYSSDNNVLKIDRSTKQTIWNVTSKYPYELILAADTLFAGGDDEIAALSTVDGSVLWTAPVEGRVRSIAVAGGGLFVSTDLGAIHCFRKVIPGDTNFDNIVDLFDFGIFSRYWLLTNCQSCDGADFTGDGSVTIDDAEILIENWLAGVEPVLYLKFNEVIGDIAFDSSPYSRNGSLINMTGSPWVPGQKNNALSFDGANDYVQVTGFKGVAGISPRTCAAWIKPQNTGTTGVIASWGRPDNGQKWYFRVNSTGELSVGVWGGYVAGTKNLADGQWHHVAAVVENAVSPTVADIRLYVDGVQDSISGSSGLTQTINTSASEDVFVGVSGSNGTLEAFFTGLIDDLRLYDHAITAAEINLLAK